MSRHSTAEDFWRKVNRTPTCWEWTAAKKQGGYGVFRMRGKRFLTHRLVWLLTYGDIPEGQKVLHKCDNPGCVNPEHLFLGTSKDNSQDMVNKGRQEKGESHHSAVLTEVDVRVVRKLFKEGWSQSAIGRMFDCDHKNIAAIVQRRTWKHIPETEETK